MNKDYQISELGASGYSKLMWDLWGKCKIPMANCELIEQRLKELGYRKQDDTAKEIFSEIKNKLDWSLTDTFKQYSAVTLDDDFKHNNLCEKINAKIDVLCDISNFIEEFMKKYMEG